MGLALYCAAATPADVGTLVEDICTNITFSSNPIGVTRVGDRILFFAQDDAGYHLWTTDGTPAGTTVVVDLPNLAVKVLGVVNGRLLYAFPGANDDDEFWRTDGTAAGTVEFAELPTVAVSFPASATTPDAAFFIDTGAGGWELWKTDGATTQKLATIAPPATPVEYFFMAAVGRDVYFPGDDDVHGLELWRSDGTPAGTGMVADLQPGPNGAHPRSPAADQAGRRLFFVATTDAGCQLWVSDGTSAGTRPVRAFEGAGICYDPPRGLTVVGGALLFEANGGGGAAGLWRSDGTAAGTVLVTNAVSLEMPLGVLADTLIFEGLDGAHGRELWRTDGTAAGTRLIADINPGGPGITLDPTSLVAGGKLYLALAGTVSNDTEPWVTDGTAVGTFELADVCQGSCGSLPFYGAALGPTVFFAANDYVHGTELWKSDGTPGSTTIVRDIRRANNSSAPFGLIDLNGTLLFLTQDCSGEGVDLWRSDGTQAGTTPLREFRSVAFGPTAAGDAMSLGGDGVYLVADDGTSGPQIWTSDGTAAGTRLALDLPPPSRFANTSFPLWWRGAFYFFADDPAGTRGLWRSDGTSQGTWLVERISYPGEARYPNTLIACGTNLFFMTVSASVPMGYDLWVTDGNPGTARLVEATDQVFFLDAGKAFPRVLGDRMFFIAHDVTHGYELWRSDGTPGGTVIVKDILPNDLWLDAQPLGLSVVHDRLVFTANDGVHGWELWTSDGTSAGTRMIADIWPGADSSIPQAYYGFLAGPGATFYFSADGPVHGRQLWVSDFTEAGTRLVADLVQPPFFPLLFDGLPLGRYFYFSFTPINPYCPTECYYGTFLYVTEGTSESTRLVAGGWPEDQRKRLSRLAVSAGCLYYSGTDLVHGEELWRACPPPDKNARRHLKRAP